MINHWTPEPNIVLHQALGKVAEEAAELAKIATRCTIQGFHEAEPVSQRSNREMLFEEVADIKAALRWLYEVIDQPYQGESPRERRKFDCFREWQAMLESEPDRSKAAVDHLPHGHTVLEQADMTDGRVAQTVRVDATGEHYGRIVHADEAYVIG